jgi:hypothetical protein
MRRILLALIIASGAPVLALAQSAPAPPPTVKDFWPSEQNDNGRFRILFSPHARADTFLLDTQTGRVWQLKGLNGEPAAWSPMTRLDSSQEQDAFARSHGVKPSRQSPTDQPTSAMPR